MGRSPALDARGEHELAVLLDLGLRQPRIAAVLGCSVRTIQRHAKRRRDAGELQTLDDALAAVPSIEQVLADDAHRLTARRSRRPSRAWRQAAVELETTDPERWGGSAVNVND
jgi:hypothetical protein